MCGIAGILGKPDRNAVQNMIDAMSRRGPDDSGLYEHPQVVLGHRRLSIIDLSAAGHQPMSRAGGLLWIVFNGEIYNFAALRQELKGRGHRFVSRTDTEVILALYEEMGVECVTRLQGMFGFAIWDIRGPEPLLVLARDHFGIKPLLYSTSSDGLVFASDLAGLLASGRVEPNIDRVALVQYLMHGHVVQPRTMLRGVEMLPAAHVLTVRPGKAPQEIEYWRLDYERCAAIGRGLKFEDQAIRIRDLLEQAARSQMVSEVPLGAFLSGGVDSTALVALMTRAAGRPIHTFSVGFPDAGADLDESEDAERSARFLGAIHRSVRIGAREVAEALPVIAADLGQPTVDGVNMYFVSRAARTGVSVALAGMGGDELFAGYGSFKSMALRQSMTQRLRRVLSLARRSPPRWLGRTSAMEDAWASVRARHGFAASYMSMRMVRGPEEAWRMAGRPEIDSAALFAYAEADDPAVPDAVSRTTLLESSLYMRSQLLRDADAASMAHSLEVRVPFLDVDLAEFTYGLPAESKLGKPAGGTGIAGKRVLLRAIGDLIPDWTWRKPKRGFTLPFGEWLRGPLRPLVEETLGDSGFRGCGWIDTQEADREWRQLLKNPNAHWSGVWTVLMLALWERNFLRTANRTVAPAAQGVH
jgi:asparagine synthase (glutamine-hydrolysing)